MHANRLNKPIYARFTFNYNRLHKETLLKFRYNVFTCPGNGKISAIVLLEKRPYISKVLHVEILILERMILQINSNKNQL